MFNNYLVAEIQLKYLVTFLLPGLLLYEEIETN